MTRFFRNLPIKHKLTAITVAISGVALLIACGAFAIYEQGAFRRAMARDVATMADVFDENAASGLAFNDTASLQQTLSTLREDPRILAAAVFDKAGVLAASYERTGQSGGFVFPAAEPTGQHWRARHLDTFKNIDLAGEIIGAVYLATDLREVRLRIWRYAAIVGVLLIACSLVALGLASRLQKIISQPIEDLAQTVATVATEKNYAVRAHKESDDELGRLIDGFNEMLAQIQVRDAALQRTRDELETRVVQRTSELAQAQARFKFIFDSVPVGISLVETDDVQQHLINPAHERITGVSAAEASRPGAFQRASHPDDYRRQMALAQPFIRNEVDHYSAEKRYLHRDGTVVWVELTSRKFIDAETGAQQAVTTLVDITERKHAEETMRESEERFSGAFEHAPIGVALVSPEGRWLRVNRAICALVGYTEAELLTRTFQQITHPADLGADLEFVRRMLVGEIPAYAMEKRYVHKLGHLISVLLNVSLVRDGAGQPRYLIAQVQDITASKQAEAALEKAHLELVAASRQAGMAEVATGVLHNVGNVLNSVNVSASLVAEQVRHTKAANIAKVAALFAEHQADLAHFLTADPRGALLPAYLGTLAEAIATEQAALATELGHLRKNVEHIKDFVAMQQNYARNSGFIETVPLVDLVDNALRMNASSLMRHDVELVRDFRLRPMVTADTHKIVQILINLVRNAQLACDDSGRTDKRVTVCITGDATRARVAVSDNGVGILAENLTRIFNHGFTTRKAGHGFGLHSGALAAKELGGSLAVQSAGPGLGATFTLELPVRSATTSPFPP